MKLETGICGEQSVRVSAENTGRLNSLSQSLTALPAPSGREPLAWRESLRLKCKAACRAYPFRLAAARQSTFPKGTASVVAGKLSA